LNEIKDKFGGEILKVFDSIDTDRNGTINYTGNLTIRKWVV